MKKKRKWVENISWYHAHPLHDTLFFDHYSVIYHHILLLRILRSVLMCVFIIILVTFLFFFLFFICLHFRNTLSLLISTSLRIWTWFWGSFFYFPKKMCNYGPIVGCRFVIGQPFILRHLEQMVQWSKMRKTCKKFFLGR